MAAAVAHSGGHLLLPEEVTARLLPLVAAAVAGLLNLGLVGFLVALAAVGSISNHLVGLTPEAGVNDTSSKHVAEGKGKGVARAEGGAGDQCNVGAQGGVVRFRLWS